MFKVILWYFDWQDEYVKNSTKMLDLEKDLSLRPTTDDVNLLKKEQRQIFSENADLKAKLDQ